VKKLVILMALTLVPQLALAQIGDLLKHADKIKKGAKVAQAATKEFTPEEELTIGRIVAARVLATYPLSKNKALQDYVSLVGQTLVPYSTRPDQVWHFAVIEADLVNAYCAPANYVFITTGAISQLKSEAELAAILGHEIAHATEMHVLTEVRRANVMAAGVDLAASGTGGLTQELAGKISDVAFQKLFKTGLGRKAELEADAVGVQLAAAAGYRSDAYLTFLATLGGLESSNSSRVAKLGKEHPTAKDRAKILQDAKKVEADGALLDDRWKKRASK
jgi:predicted Zn-dependent protease